MGEVAVGAVVEGHGGAAVCAAYGFSVGVAVPPGAAHGGDACAAYGFCVGMAVSFGAACVIWFCGVCQG